MIFSRNQRHTAVFFKYFLGKYILLDLYWTEPEGRSLEAFPIGTKNSWNERILSLSFLLFWYSNGSHYHLLHIDTCQCFFSWDSCSGFGVYIFRHFIYYDITFWCRTHKHHFGNGRKIFLFLVPHLFKKMISNDVHIRTSALLVGKKALLQQ